MHYQRVRSDDDEDFDEAKERKAQKNGE